MPPDADPQQTQRISSEVIGRFTDDQQHDLETLFLAVFGKKELDPLNKDHVAEVGEIVRDSVMRGIQLRGKVWISPYESVGRYFELGFNQRKSMVDELYALGGEGKLLEYATVPEEFFTSAVSPYDRDFTTHEQVLAELKGRKKSIATLHHHLFEEPPLGEQAQEILGSIDPLITRELNEDNTKWIKYNMLFGNFLAHLAFYQQPGIAIEPQDIAALADLWKNDNAKHASHEKLIGVMSDMAKHFAMPVRHIALYTQNILENMSLSLAEGQVTVENLTRDHVFAIAPQLLQREEIVFRENRTTSKEVKRVTKEELQAARAKADQILRMYVQYNKLAASESEEPAENEEFDETSDEADAYLMNEYIPAFERLTPQELYAVYEEIPQRDATLNIGQDEMSLPYSSVYDDLLSFVPVTIYIDTLTMVKTADWPEQISNEIEKKIEQFVLDMLVREDTSRKHMFKEIIEKIPVETLNTYLSTVDAAKMDQDRLTAVLALEVEKWVVLAEENEVEADESIVGEPDFVFTGSDYLKGFFDQLPAAKRASLHRKLLHEIEY